MLKWVPAFAGKTMGRAAMTRVSRLRLALRLLQFDKSENQLARIARIGSFGVGQVETGAHSEMGPAFEREKKCRITSFRGAGPAREPGTYEHRTGTLEKSVCMGSGPALVGIPE